MTARAARPAHPRSRSALRVPPLLLIASALVAGASCGRSAPAAPARPADAEQRLRVRVHAVYDHDPEAYTQGLLWHNGALYESTGQYGKSSVRRVDLPSGKVERRADLPPDVFGEGIARVGRELVQITWHEGRAFRFALPDLALRRETPFRGEGWGLEHDGRALVMSDGSHVLTFRDAESFAILRSLVVRRRGAPLDRLNELELAEGVLYANVYQTDEIVVIDLASGRVRATIDASPLRSPAWGDRAEALNGIAYRAESRTFLVTGKLWPQLFEVSFEPAP